MASKLRRREGGKELIAGENKIQERGYICYGIAEAIIICKSQTMYLRLRQSILVSDKVSRSQTIYLSLNQYILVSTNVIL